ncbi:MAG: NUDIX domain-containing protein [Phenylobacterium sp.]
MTDPQFGLASSTGVWPDRPSVFGIARRGGRIALVEIGDPADRIWLALPGGGIEPGEDDATALIREFREETGLLVQPLGSLGASSDRVLLNAGRSFNVRGRFFEVRILKENPAWLVEPDHRLVWRTPLQAIRSLHRESHAWAVAQWLRSRS